MKEFSEFIGTLLFYLAIALGAVVMLPILISIVLLAVKGCLYALGQITPMLGVY